jgi:hypothetical protein
MGSRSTDSKLCFLFPCPVCLSLPPTPKQDPAWWMEIGRERGSAEAASQRADAALSWNALEGGVLDSFRRLGTGSGCSWTASKGQ